MAFLCSINSRFHSAVVPIFNLIFPFVCYHFQKRVPYPDPMSSSSLDAVPPPALTSMGVTDHISPPNSLPRGLSDSEFSDIDEHGLPISRSRDPNFYPGSGGVGGPLGGPLPPSRRYVSMPESIDFDAVHNNNNHSLSSRQQLHDEHFRMNTGFLTENPAFWSGRPKSPDWPLEYYRQGYLDQSYRSDVL